MNKHSPTKDLAEAAGISRRHARLKKSQGLNTPEKIAIDRAAKGRIRIPVDIARKIGMEKLRLIKAQASQAEIALAERKKEVIDFATVDRFLSSLVEGYFFGAMAQRDQRLPGVLKGMDEVNIHAKLSESTEEMKSALRNKLQEMKKA